MVRKKKSSASARGASAIKAISSAQKAAVGAFAGWGKAVTRASSTAEKNVAAAFRKTASLKNRAVKALKRVKKARAAEVKAVARDARQRVLTDLAAARATLTSARQSHATSKAAHKLFQLIEKGMAGGKKIAEKAAAKAAKPKRRRRRRK